MKKYYLKNIDGSRQEVEIIYSPVLEEGGFEGKPMIKYKEPMACIRMVGVDIQKKWSIKMQPVRFLERIKR